MRRTVSKLVGGSAIAQLALFIAMPVVTRLYGPEELGTYNTEYAVSLFLATLMFMRYELTLTIASEDTDVRLSHAVCIAIGVLIYLVSCMGLSIVSKMFYPTRNDAALLLFALPFLGFLVAYQNYFNLFFTRRGDFDFLNFAKVSVPTLTVLLQIVAGISFPTSDTLLASVVAANLLILFFFLIKFHRIIRPVKNFQAMLIFAKRHFGFARYTTISDSLLVFGAQFPIIFLSMTYGVATTAFFALANRIALIPIVLISEGVGRVFMNRVIRMNQLDIANVSEDFLHLLFRIGLLTIGIFLLVSKLVLPLVFGNDWSNASQILTYLFFIVLAMFASVPVMTLFPMLKMQRAEMYSQIAIMGSKILGLTAGTYLFGYEFGVLSYSILGALAYFIVVIFLMSLLKVAIFRLLKELVVRNLHLFILNLVGLFVIGQYNSLTFKYYLYLTGFGLVLGYFGLGALKELRIFEVKYFGKDKVVYS